MRQYEVLGSTRACILISISEALLRDVVGEEQIENFWWGRMAYFLQHTSNSGGKRLFAFGFFACLPVSLLPGLSLCMRKINVLSLPFNFFEGPSFANSPNFESFP